VGGESRASDSGGRQGDVLRGDVAPCVKPPAVQRGLKSLAPPFSAPARYAPRQEHHDFWPTSLGAQVYAPLPAVIANREQPVGAEAKLGGIRLSVPVALLPRPMVVDAVRGTMMFPWVRKRVPAPRLTCWR